MKAIVVPGRRFGRLVVLASRAGRLRAAVKCDCGTEGVVFRSSLLKGSTTSCGRGLCRASTTHGHTINRGRTPEFSTWMNIRLRCHGTSADPRYVSRGISVCEQWRGSFEAFLADMGPRPSLGHSIDRINNAGNYEPGNCRWATRKEQMRNVRTNLIVEFRGRPIPFAQACEEANVNRKAVYSRMLRWGASFETAIERPIVARKKAA